MAIVIAKDSRGPVSFSVISLLFVIRVKKMSTNI